MRLSAIPGLSGAVGLQRSQASDSKASRGPFQGSIEQLASPAQNEMSDFAKFTGPCESLSEATACL